MEIHLKLILQFLTRTIKVTAGAYTLLVFFLVSCDKKEEDIAYYPDGQIRHVGQKIDGINEGKFVEYYPTGEIRSTIYYSNGKLNGESTLYIETGVKVQIIIYENNIRKEQWNWRDDGSFSGHAFYNSKGELFDYLSYINDSTRDYDPLRTRAVVSSKQDTVKLGETFYAYIRLGNRRYNKTEVVIGTNSTDKKVIKMDRLPKKDSVTSIYIVEANELGYNEFKGVVLDVKLDENSEEESWILYPFKSSFYVTNDSP